MTNSRPATPRAFLKDGFEESHLVSSIFETRHISALEVEAFLAIRSDDSIMYLQRSTVLSYISADVSDASLDDEVRRKKLFIGRLKDLLPSILGYLRFRKADDFQILNAIGCIDDCHYDFSLSETYSRRDKAYNDIEKRIHAAMRNIAEAANIIGPINTHLESFFPNTLEARSFSQGASNPKAIFQSPLSYLDFLRCFLEVCLIRLKEDDGLFFLHKGSPKSVVVDYAYTLSQLWGGPELKTTPGSEFANLCSILFEAVSGSPSQSLAGAVNRYARSPNRISWDKMEEEANAQEADPEFEDNFSAQKIWAKHRIDELYARLKLAETSLSYDAKSLIKQLVEYETSQVISRLEEYGPHHTGPYIPGLTPDDEVARIRILEEQAIQLRAQLGRARRQRDEAI